MKTKKVTTTLSTLAVLVLLAGIVSAYGVGQEYHNGRPLKVYAGEEVVVELNLQNTENAGDVTVIAEFTNDANGMATFVYEDNSYLLPEGSYDNFLPIKIRVPESAQIGEKASVGINFKQVDNEDLAGVLTFGVGSGHSFPLVVTTEEESSHYDPNPTPAVIEEPAEEGSNMMWYIIALIVVIGLVWYLKKKK